MAPPSPGCRAERSHSASRDGSRVTAQPMADGVQVEPVHGCPGEDQIKRSGRGQVLGLLDVPDNAGGVASRHRLPDPDHRGRCLDCIDVADSRCQGSGQSPFAAPRSRTRAPTPPANAVSSSIASRGYGGRARSASATPSKRKVAARSERGFGTSTPSRGPNVSPREPHCLGATNRPHARAAFLPD